MIAVILVGLIVVGFIVGFVVIGRKMVADTRSTLDEWQKLDEEYWRKKKGQT